MPKFLRAVRLDESDDQVFRSCGAAREGEWVVSGGYAACDFANAPRCDPPCRCQASFVAVGSRARCTIAEVAEASAADIEAHTDALAWHLVKDWGAPSWEAARAVAEEEVRHTVEVCETLEPDVWITVNRERSGADEPLEERYSVYDRLLVGSHKVGT